MIVSGLTMLGFGHFLGPRYSSYPDLLDVLRARAAEYGSLGHSLFERIVFNVAIGNTDDHARNHAAFWEGEHLGLTPAYDLCAQPRSGEEARQAMDISRDGARASQFTVCVDAAHEYGLSRKEATDIVRRQIHIIRESWEEVSDMSWMTRAENTAMWGRQIPNPYASYGFDA